MITIICMYSPLWVCFWVYFGMSHHFMGKNGVKNGMVYHFWNFRVYSRDRHYRTLYRGSIYRSAIYYIKLEYFKCKAFLLDSKKDTIILYYYSIFLFLVGHGLHLKTNVRQRKPGYLFHSYIDLKIRNHPKKYTIFTSISTSSKPTNHAIFDTSNTIKKSPL